MHKISINNQCTFRPLPLQRQLRAWAIKALTGTINAAWLSIQLVDAAESAALNKEYRGKAYATNVLSFPLAIPVQQKLPFIGDLVICPSIVWQEALEQEKPYIDHFCHMVLHGVLHLLGYDHIDEMEALEMERCEIQLLNALLIANPYE